MTRLTDKTMMYSWRRNSRSLWNLGRPLRTFSFPRDSRISCSTSARLYTSCRCDCSYLFLFKRCSGNQFVLLWKKWTENSDNCIVIKSVPWNVSLCCQRYEFRPMPYFLYVYVCVLKRIQIVENELIEQRWLQKREYLRYIKKQICVTKRYWWQGIVVCFKIGWMVGKHLIYFFKMIWIFKIDSKQGTHGPGRWKFLDISE